MSRFVDFKAVKAAVSMLQVLERYGLAESFKRSGNSLSGPCPLHNGENRTQFRVSLDKNCWNCFGTCKGGGNVLDFVARKENVSLREAALLLCDWFQLTTQDKPKEESAGATTKAEAKPAKKPPPIAESTPEDSDESNKPLGFALQNLDASHPYFTARGLSADAVAKFGLGYCQKGSMTGRIVIPIHNVSGQLVAYAGRFPGTPEDDDTPKYKLPPGFRKAQELFNLHRAAAEPAESPLYVVEGFFDCVRLWQLGVHRVVGLMGDSLLPNQMKLIADIVSSSDRIVLMFDEDKAGRAGREKAAAALSMLCFVRTIKFSQEGQQPDSLTPEQWQQLAIT